MTPKPLKMSAKRHGFLANVVASACRGEPFSVSWYDVKAFEALQDGGTVELRNGDQGNTYATLTPFGWESVRDLHTIARRVFLDIAESQDRRELSRDNDREQDEAWSAFHDLTSHPHSVSDVESVSAAWERLRAARLEGQRIEKEVATRSAARTLSDGELTEKLALVRKAKLRP